MAKQHYWNFQGMSGVSDKPRSEAMLIVLFAAAMCLAMLIATALTMREEAEKGKVEILRHDVRPLAIRRNTRHRL
jgi:hypothetical protein